MAALPELAAEVTGRKENFSDVEEILESAHKQIKADAGRGHKENTTESTKVVRRALLF